MLLAVKINKAMLKEAARALASKGGKARAAKYSKKELSKMGAKGGRPRRGGKR